MKLSASRALLASLFAAAALSACSSGSSNNPATCNTSSDCEAGDTCVNSQCLAPGECPTGIASCTTASECGSGMACTNGCCAAATGCTSNAACTTAAKPYCDVATGVCQPCTASTECTTGKICTAAGECATSCSSDSSCSGATPHCVTSGGYCAACTESSQCPTSAPFCTNNVCTGCSSNANCAAPTPVCDTATKACVACLDAQNANGKNAACPAAKPACESGACVACNPADNADGGANGACAAATPSCSPASTCVACTQSSECAAGSTCGSDNTCTAVALVGFAASAQSVTIGGTATFTATLNGDVTQPVTINVAIAADGGAQGTLSAATIVISSGHTGTVTYTAPSSAGTATVTATFGSTTLNASINVTASTAALASVNVMGASPIAEGSAVMATVSFTAAPTTDAAVTVSANNGATVNGSASATITVPAGSDVSAPFTVQLACSAAATTITAAFNGVTQTATVTPAAASVSVASLTASSTTPAMGAPTTLTVTLSGPAGCGGQRVTLASGVAYPTTSKFNGYIPSYITVPAGQTTASVAAVPECYSGEGDVINVTAAIPGSAPVAITTPLTITPSTGLAAGQLALCPITPVSGDRLTTYRTADGGTAPLPVVISVGYADYKVGTGTYAVALSATSADGGVCGTFTQDGGPITGVTFTTPTKTDVSFIPSGVAGPCTLVATGTVTTDGGAPATYDAGVASTYNLVAYDWSQQLTPTDLTLTKAEIDEDTNAVGQKANDAGTIYGDNSEYIEIYNPTSQAISLANYALVFVGSPFDVAGVSPATKSEYWSYPLSGTLAAGAYLIAQDASAFTAAPNTNTTLATWPDAGYAASVAAGLDGGTSGALRVGNIWNTPGGIFLVKNPGTANAAIVDGVTFGNPIQQATSASITGTDGGVFSWPPAPLAPNDNYILDSSFVKGSLVRVGWTGIPSLDWADSTTVTPGAANSVITGP